MQNRARSIHNVPTGKHARDARGLVLIDRQPAPFIDGQFTEIARLREGHGLETHRRHNVIRVQIEFRAGLNQKRSRAAILGCAQIGADKSHPFHVAPLIPQHSRRCGAEDKPGAFFDRVSVFTPIAGHIGFSTPTHSNRLPRAITNCRPQAIDRRVSAAQHHHSMAGCLNRRSGVDGIGLLQEKWQRLDDSLQIDAGDRQRPRLARIQPEIHRVKVCQQLAQRDLFPKPGSQTKLHSALLQDLEAPFQDRLVQLERRHAVDQQPARNQRGIKNRGRIACLRQILGAAQAARA